MLPYKKHSVYSNVHVKLDDDGVKEQKLEKSVD